MMRWLAVVGIGEDGLAGLAPAGRALYDAAEIVVGGARHLAMVPEDGRRRIAWPPVLADLANRLADFRGIQVCVLATGDPMWFGVGAMLAKRIAIEEMVVVPAPSAFGLACARMGWALQDVRTVTLHGRPIDLAVPHVQPGARLVVLSADRTTPAALAERLCRHGYGPSRIAVLEHMGGPAERRIDGTAEGWGGPAIADLNTVAVECRPSPGARLLPPVPGLPDSAFEHDGQLTKREIRAATLAALGPVPGQMLWDIGAGCGSVAIEWLRCDPRNRAVAIERDAGRVALIAANMGALGTPFLEVVAGEAPGALADDLPPPDAVFVGGGLTTPGLVQRCWEALGPGGRMVANAVTVEGEGALAAHRAALGGELVRIAVSRAEPVGPYLGWRPLMPVTQWAAVKP